MDGVVKYLYDSTKDGYQWVEKLLDGIEYNLWDHIPSGIESSLSWQVGHLTLSFYYHTMMVIVGHQKDIIDAIPLKDYNKYFTQTQATVAVGKIAAEDLVEHFQIMTDKSLSIISSLTNEDLSSHLVETGHPHPVADTKRGALDWNIKHTMWHCGQIAMLRRIHFERYDFGQPKRK